MSVDVFHIVVTVAVGLACLGVIALAIVALALFRAVQSIHQKLGPVLERVQPVLEQIPPVVGRVETTLQKAALVIDRAAPVIDKIGPMVERVGAAADHLVPVADRAGELLANSNRMLTEVRPKIADIADETLGIVKSGREQVERVGNLLHDAGDRAQSRLEQIDRTVEHTVDQVEQVGDKMKRAVMSPVREVNGLAAGISAAVSSLVHGPRRPSVDEATQDEEMFI